MEFLLPSWKWLRVKGNPPQFTTACPLGDWLTDWVTTSSSSSSSPPVCPLARSVGLASLSVQQCSCFFLSLSLSFFSLRVSPSFSASLVARSFSHRCYVWVYNSSTHIVRVCTLIHTSIEYFITYERYSLDAHICEEYKKKMNVRAYLNGKLFVNIFAYFSFILQRKWR